MGDASSVVCELDEGDDSISRDVALYFPLFFTSHPMNK
jgi:hypothetical protein